MKLRKTGDSLTVIRRNIEETIKIEFYDPKYIKSRPKDYPEVFLFHASGPCKGIGIRIHSQVFKKMAEWFLSKDINVKLPIRKANV